MSQTAVLSPPTPARRVPKGRILTLLAGVQLIVVLDASIVNIALPAIQRGLGMSPESLQWVLNAYTLMLGGFMLLGGRLADRFGRRRMFLTGMAVFTLASLLGGFAQSELWLIGARALQGLGGAILLPTTLSIIMTTFAEGPERNRALGVFGAVAGSAGAVGVLLGGVLTQYLGWQSVLFLNVPIGLAVFVLAPRVLRESRSGGTGGLDALGAVTVTAGLLALVYGFVTAAQDGWAAPVVLGAFAAAGLLLAAFVGVEARSADPLVPLSVFRRRNLTGASVVTAVQTAAFLGMFYLLSLYLQQVLGFSALNAGLAYLPLSLGIIVSSTVASRLVARFGPRALIVSGLALMAAGLGLFARISPDGSFAADVLIPSLIIAVAVGLVSVPLVTAASAGTTGRDAGLTSGLISAAQSLGGSLGLAMLVTIAANRTGGALASLGRPPSPADILAAQVDGYARAVLAAAAFAVAAAIIAALTLPSRHRAAHHALGTLSPRTVEPEAADNRRARKVLPAGTPHTRATIPPSRTP
jgi:EmrB/QacA subfamily drug resistance transporter